MSTKLMMKKKTPILVAALLLVCSSMASAGTIAESPHDFRGYLWSQSGEICEPCHTPHQTKPLPLPLWNYELKTETYTLYATDDAEELDGKKGFRPSGSSKMCLSCHDGTIAPETFGDVTDGTGHFHKDMMYNTDFGSNHPVSFIYDAFLSTANGDLYDPTIKLSGVINSEGTINDDLLFQGRMECSSCHDVHNTRAVAETKLLLKDNAGSGLCLTCHDK